RKLAAERPLKDIRDEYNYPKKKGIKDECSRLLEASTMKSRRGFAIQRLMNAMRQAHADGWFIVFDTLTLADDRLEARSEERFSRNAETELVCRLLLEKKNATLRNVRLPQRGTYTVAATRYQQAQGYTNG